METTKKTPPNTNTETQPSLLIRPLEIDTLIKQLARAQTQFNLLLAGPRTDSPARHRHFPRIIPCTQNNNFLVFTLIKSFHLRSTAFTLSDSPRWARNSTCYDPAAQQQKQNKALTQTVESSVYTTTSYMSSKNPTQLREPPPGFEPGMVG
jgi:hypothetical protein